ncbi:MAG: MBL fold metallo-hydrolase [Eubacterium sp.]|nr:MBL fold metallo-hydrolase [Eubacterium sp.]
MLITCIDHSGFLVETETANFLFDWYTGTLPAFDCSKPLFVFVSHSHSDHFSQEIFQLNAAQWILSYDIPERSLPKDPDIRKRIVTMQPHEEVNINNNWSGTLKTDSISKESLLKMNPHDTNKFTVNTLASNDLGIAFVVHTSEGDIYHAGDLNNWWWDGDEEDRELKKIYHTELDRIKGSHFRIAMVPYDLRLSQPGFGIRDFLACCQADTITAMHLNTTTEKAEKYMQQDAALKGVKQHVYIQPFQLQC